MMLKFTYTTHARTLIALIAMLAGCGENEESSPTPPPPPPPPPVTAFTVGGSVTGLASSELILQLNGANDLIIGGNGRFNFPNKLSKGSTYSVAIKTIPSVPVKQTCTVSQGSGNISGAAINNVAVACVTNSYAVGGKVSGLSGKGLALQLNGANDVAVVKNGNFIFPGVRLPDGSDYSVAIKATPAKQQCRIEPINSAPDNDTINIVSVSCSKKGRR